MPTQNLTFQWLPVACVLWPHSNASGSTLSNLAFNCSFGVDILPELSARAIGQHTLRLRTRSAEQRVCRVTISVLPDGSRLGVIEDVHAFYLDILTGLDDRRALLLDTATPVLTGSLVLLDIDNFKSVNDAHGHAAGDKVLHALATLLADAARGLRARAYRLGGDEFVLFSPGPLVSQQLAPLQDRFGQVLAALGEAAQSFSYGLAHAPDNGSTLGTLLEHADARLLSCKGQRRSGPGTVLTPPQEWWAPLKAPATESSAVLRGLETPTILLNSGSVNAPDRPPEPVPLRPHTQRRHAQPFSER